VSFRQGPGGQAICFKNWWQLGLLILGISGNSVQRTKRKGLTENLNCWATFESLRFISHSNGMSIFPLENRCTFTGTVGSNPTASANYFKHLAVKFWQKTGCLFKRKYWLVQILVRFCTLKPRLPWNHWKPGHGQAQSPKSLATSLSAPQGC